MKLTPQRGLLLFWLVSLCWGGGLIAVALATDGQGALLSAAWGAGAALLLLLALYLGLAVRLDLLNLQQVLREVGDPQGSIAQQKSRLARLWWPLIDSVAAHSAPKQAPVAEHLAALRAQIDTLQSGLAAERAQTERLSRQLGHSAAALERQHSSAQAALHWLRQVEDTIPDDSAWPATMSTDERSTPGAVSEAQAGLAALVSLLSAARAELRTQSVAAADARESEPPSCSTAVTENDLTLAAQSLALSVDDLQLLGLNLRLSLAHLDEWPSAEQATLDQVAVELETLITGAKGLTDAVHGIARQIDSSTRPPRQLPEEANPLLSASRLALQEQLDQAARQADRLATMLQVQDTDCADMRAQLGRWQAAGNVIGRRLESLRPRLQVARQHLQGVAERTP